MPLQVQIDRRNLFSGLSLAALSHKTLRGQARVEVSNHVSLLGDQRIGVTRYTDSTSDQPRGTVLMLHGTKGVAERAAAYDFYGRRLASSGLNAWLFEYFAEDQEISIRRAEDSLARETLYAEFVNSWVKRIDGLADLARRQPGASAQVGLLGFSLGGMVGVAAANGSRFAALSVFYGSIPSFYHHQITSLPPLLELHGSADVSVPVSLGSDLVRYARSLGGRADQETFARQGHAFDLDLSNPAAIPARAHAISFLHEHLAQR